MGSLQAVMDQSPPSPDAAAQLAELEGLFQTHHGAVMRAAYRVTGGTGVFAGAKGAGTLSAVFTRGSPTQPSATSLYLRGTLE